MKNQFQFKGFVSVLTICFLLSNVKISAQPAIMWQNTIGSTANDILEDIIQTSDGGYLMGGFNSGCGINGDKTVTGSCWLVKVNNIDVIEWQKGYGVVSSIMSFK